ncbi:uncharacterized protein BDZ83DRAFT_376312 [Colletotrichum acutatum]|uniref:Uncharacterized protein n=1 Tax=Glomerella acutata TaxID=27357 RepID=A0AAD9D2H4_GLOAC|nr:uncharacterized protein BDZ83DRAFT_376312 [Colletotrichum acutatum]KAK1730601.1 hypothetical protein BDZ83DRAFT_376312 [Colletotrichum acutatum]
MGSGLSSVSNSYPSCTYRQTLNEQGKVRCRVGDTNHDSSWGDSRGRSRTRQPEQAFLVLRIVAALGCVNDVCLMAKCHCRRRFKRSSPLYSFHPAPSPLYQALVCLPGKVISYVYVALPIKGPSLAGTAGCEAPWVGVDKDVMAAWPSIFNSSGDFFRPPCHRLSVTTHCWPVTPAHQAKPNGTSFCGQTPSRQRWPTFCCSETPLGMAARSHRDHPSTLA